MTITFQQHQYWTIFNYVFLSFVYLQHFPVDKTYFYANLGFNIFSDIHEDIVYYMNLCFFSLYVQVWRELSYLKAKWILKINTDTNQRPWHWFCMYELWRPCELCVENMHNIDEIVFQLPILWNLHSDFFTP